MTVFLSLGLLSPHAFEEIFVASPKYFKIWTNHGNVAAEVLESAGIPMSEQLEFIDEYPMVSESIGENRNAAWADPFYTIQDAFAKLPLAENTETEY